MSVKNTLIYYFLRGHRTGTAPPSIPPSNDDGTLLAPLPVAVDHFSLTDTLPVLADTAYDALHYGNHRYNTPVPGNTAYIDKTIDHISCTLSY